MPGSTLRLLVIIAWMILMCKPWASAQSAPPVVYQRYDVHFTIAADSTFRVREIQQIRFDGQFTRAFAEIPLAYTTGIDDILVLEDERVYQRDGAGPGSFTVEVDGQQAYVDWVFTETRPGDVRTFIIEYTVRGGLWVYPSDDPSAGGGEALLEWRAVPADRSGVPVQASRVVVDLPAPVAPQDLHHTAFGIAFSAQASPRQVVFEAADPIPDGTAFHVQIGIPLGIVNARAQAWQISEDAANLVYRYVALETDFVIQPDGSVAVEERHHIAVEAGAMRQGTHTFRHTGMEDVTAVAVFLGEQALSPGDGACDYCFSVRKTSRSPAWVGYDPRYDTVSTEGTLAGTTEVVWTVPALVRGEEAIFSLRYTLLGALSLHPDAQVFQWTIIPDEQDVVVEAARVRIELPSGLEPADVQVTASPGRSEPQTDGSLLLVHPGPIVSYEPWKFSLTLPAGATAAVKPQWQQQMEAVASEARRAQTRQARGQLLAGGLALAILTIGLLSLLLIWQRWGRDEPVPLMAEYLSEPPSDPAVNSGQPLPPGIVAYLLDEKPSTDGALASLFHLASLGLLRIELVPQVTVQRNWPEMLSSGQTIVTPDDRTIAIPGHLTRLFNELAPAIPTDTSRKLAAVAGQFRAALPGVYQEMAQETRAFFTVAPDRARRLWRSLGRSIALLGVLALLVSCFLTEALGVVAATPGIAFVIVGMAWALVSRWMPQRNPAGAVEAARWRAFRRYLLNLKEYGGQAEAKAILDRYFAYAIAMDVQDIVLRAAEDLGAEKPLWTRSMVVAARQAGPVEAGRSGAGRSWQPLTAQPSSDETTIERPASSRADSPSLSGLSRQMGAALNRASLDLGRTLSAAAGDGSSTMDAMSKALRSASGSSGTRYSSGSPSRSRSSGSSRSSSGSGSRSSSRSSGGGGRRGFG